MVKILNYATIINKRFLYITLIISLLIYFISKNMLLRGRKMKEKRNVNLEILSEVYSIKSDIPEDELMAMRDLVDSKMRAVQEKAPHLSFKVMAVIVALELAKEKLDLDREYLSLNTLLKDEKLIF